MRDGRSLSDRLTRLGIQAPPDGLLADEDIVARVLGGDLASFELIMRRYNQRLFRVVRGIVSDDDEAEDVVQDCYVRAYEHLAQFEGRARFSTWLTRIAVHEAMARRKRQARVRPLSDGAGASAPREREDEASVKELGDVLAAAVDALPAELRAVFVLRAVEGLDTREAADCLELSESNVKIRLHRARAILQTWIDHRLGSDVRRLYQFDGERCDRIVTSVLERLTG
jgi:RNA polymerase sigma-70 factor (ECF subfamily)